MVGPFPESLGWLWYLLVSFLSLLTFSITITINLARILLILMVRAKELVFNRPVVEGAVL